MTTDGVSFEEAVAELMGLALQEEDSVHGDSTLNDEEKQQILLILTGYKKALQDILSVCMKQDEGEQE